VSVLAAGLLLGAGAARARPESFAVEPEASRIRIELRRSGLLKFLGHDHTIEAPLAEGRVEADLSDLRLSRVWLRWDARRLAVVPGTEPAEDVPDVERRMRGPEVLDVDRHPAIVFRSSAIAGETDGAGLYRLKLRGELELRGTGRPVELALTVRREGDRLSVTGEADLRLRDLGVDPPSVAGVVKVADRFRLRFEVRARRVPEPPVPGG